MTDFAGGHFLFIYSDTFVARIMVTILKSQTDRQQYQLIMLRAVRSAKIIHQG